MQKGEYSADLHGIRLFKANSQKNMKISVNERAKKDNEGELGSSGRSAGGWRWRGAIFPCSVPNLPIRGLYTDIMGMICSRAKMGPHSDLKITEILDIFSTPKIIMKMGF
jgi:hypothetical protein